MTRSRVLLRAVVVSLLLTCMARAAGAQGTGAGSILGKVSDETGAAMPGVTVTLTSPALQVPELTNVSGAEGSYRFENLPPGVYRIKYELPGFSTIIREDQRLNAGFAARIDVTMKVGALEETLTVSGQAPVIDTTTTAGSTNFTKEMLEKIPTSRSMWQVLAMTPGVRVTSTPDVGGSTVGTQQSYSNYGTSGQNKPTIEGIDTREGEGGSTMYYDYNAFEEVQVKAVGNDAEMALPGTNFVGIVKSGGNEFHGTYFASGQRPELQSSNIDDKLRAQGVRGGNPLIYYWDFAADLGGRIVRDKLWFYGAFRHQRNVRRVLGYASAPGPDGKFGTADDVPGESLADLIDYTAKVSYQPTKNYKVIGFIQINPKIEPEREGTRFRPREAAYDYTTTPKPWKFELQGTPSSRLLLNAIFGHLYYRAVRAAVDKSGSQPSRFYRDTSLRTGPHENQFDRYRTRWQSNGGVSYFPEEFLGGTHSLKVGYGVAIEWLGIDRYNRNNGNYLLTYDRGLPVEITTYNLPILSGKGKDRMTDFSVYAKDTWNISGRLTANLGVRWERYHSFIDAATKAQGTFGTGGDFPAVDLLTWSRLAPRVGVAWDLKGDGKTVVKGTYGWFNHTMADDFASNFNRNTLLSTTYRWRDLDGNNNYTPGEVNLDPNGSDFISITGGNTGVQNPDLRQPVTHEIAADLERQLMANFSARLYYVYKRQHDLYNFVNVRRPLGAWNIPITRRDPGPDGVLNTSDDAGSVTFYDYNAAFRGAAFVGNQPQNRPSGRDDAYHTIEMTLNKRTSQNWDTVSSVSWTRNHRWLTTGTTSAAIPNTPNDLFFPVDNTWNWQVKITGSYHLPRNFIVAGFFQSLSGDPAQRTYIFRRVDPDGGTPINQASTVTLRLEPFGARREPALSVLNIRGSKRLSFRGGRRLEFDVDLFNALNANAASQIDYQSGPTFGVISQILPPRIVRLGVTFAF
ncbi:MAG: TonB-dependent receptor [Acidobacteria bacterium]|nr:TonB-dependent receptor [Acidobacteriota bacterium]